MYSRYEVYPSYFDEIEPCPKENCKYGNGDCINAGYCIIEKEENNMDKSKLYNKLDELLRKTNTMECIDFTWHKTSASIDLYDIISQENEKEDLFFEEVRELNKKLQEFYKTELKEFPGDCEMGAQARIYFWRR